MKEVRKFDIHDILGDSFFYEVTLFLGQCTGPTTDQEPDRYNYVSQRAAAARGTGHQGVQQRPDRRTTLFEQRRLQLGLG